MERVPRGSCNVRFEVRMPTESGEELRWLKMRLHRSGNAIVRAAIRRMYEEERRAMLIQAGFQDGRLP